MDAVTVGSLLGGQNFTSCSALSGSNASATTTGSMPLYTAAADRVGSSLTSIGTFLAIVFGVWAFFL